MVARYGDIVKLLTGVALIVSVLWLGCGGGHGLDVGIPLVAAWGLYCLATQRLDGEP